MHLFGPQRGRPVLSRKWKNSQKNARGVAIQANLPVSQKTNLGTGFCNWASTWLIRPIARQKASHSMNSLRVTIPVSVDSIGQPGRAIVQAATSHSPGTVL